MIIQEVIPKLIIWMDLTDDLNKKVAVLLFIKALPVISGSSARTASSAGAAHGKLEILHTFDLIPGGGGVNVDILQILLNDIF